jgi:subtilisin family serine protease
MASEQNDCRASFSNYSPSGTPSQFNITAPGYEILSTYPDAQYKTLSGTSMATPVVAGVAAMVWGKFPADTRAGLVNRILNSGKVTGCGFAANTKRVNLRAAITGTGETAIVGRLLDPFTGKATSPQSTVTTAQLKSGATVLASDATTKGGFYEITGLAAGTSRTLKGVKTGAVNDVFLRSGIAITAGAVAGPFTDAFPASRATGNAAVTLDWRNLQPQLPEVDCATGCKLGWEMDLIVKLPDGSYILPYFINSTMWQGELLGAPFVRSPRDSYGDSEPLETVVIGSSAANGTYQVVVLNGGDGTTNWGFNPQWTNSGASVQVYNGAAPLTGASHQAVPAACGSSFFWHVGSMVKTGTSYVWTAVNTCTNTLP